MNFRVRLGLRAKHALVDILNDPSNRYSETERLSYIESIRRICAGLSEFPNRFAIDEIQGAEFRSITFKAHRIFYLVDEELREATIAAILHKRMDHQSRLPTP